MTAECAAASLHTVLLGDKDTKQHAHSTNPAEILCNSMITTADKGVSSNNKT